jgi:hypothetical protein
MIKDISFILNSRQGFGLYKVFRPFWAYLTHPQPLSFEKERGDGYYSTHHYFPLFNPVREGE